MVTTSGKLFDRGWSRGCRIDPTLLSMAVESQSLRRLTVYQEILLAYLFLQQT